jgi:hypothetical protein
MRICLLPVRFSFTVRRVESEKWPLRMRVERQERQDPKLDGSFAVF